MHSRSSGWFEANRLFLLASPREAMPNPDVAAGAPPPKRSRFSLDKCPKPCATPCKLPDLSDLTQDVKTLPAPPGVRETLQGSTSFVAIDCETHALVPRGASPSFWRPGEFGFLTTADDVVLSSLRLVQIGWAYVPEGAHAPVVKHRLIKPEAFVVEDSATAKHGITHASALSHGKALGEGLRELLRDVTALVNKGYRICGHHLGFDAGIILRELGRAHLGDSAGTWEQMAREGLCTMDPDICHWVRKQIGLADKPRSIPMRLRDLITILLPQHAQLVAQNHHAGVDAHMHVLLAQELRRRAVS